MPFSFSLYLSVRPSRLVRGESDTDSSSLRRGGFRIFLFLLFSVLHQTSASLVFALLVAAWGTASAAWSYPTQTEKTKSFLGSVSSLKGAMLKSNLTRMFRTLLFLQRCNTRTHAKRKLCFSKSFSYRPRRGTDSPKFLEAGTPAAFTGEVGIRAWRSANLMRVIFCCCFVCAYFLSC